MKLGVEILVNKDFKRTTTTTTTRGDLKKIKIEKKKTTVPLWGQEAVVRKDGWWRQVSSPRVGGPRCRGPISDRR